MRTRCPALDELDALASGSSVAAGSHVESCPRCQRRLAKVRGNLAFLANLADPAAEPGCCVGGAPTLPGYEILHELHRGGQGVVYRARQLATRREVALKIPLAGTLATSAQRRRFEREIELAASLRHPSIVTIHDGGATADGRLYCAMELVHGTDLRAFVHETIRRRSADDASLRELLSTFAGICDAIAHAHQHGVIHRDLKPSNVLIDARGVPVVVDFGLAVSTLCDAHVTRGGEFAGSLAYASPEHLAGRPNAVEARSDVYALGVMLYEMLAGRNPHAVDAPLDELVRSVVEINPPALRGAARWRVDARLEAIVRKALRKNPRQRYQSAAALAEDLRRYLRGEAIEARRASLVGSLLLLARRHRFESAAGAVLLLAVVGFAIAMTAQASRLERERRRAVAMEQSALREADAVQRASAFLVGLLHRLDPTSNGTRVHNARELLDDAAKRLDELGDRPEFQAAVMETVGTAYTNLGAYERAAELLERALHQREQADPSSAALARTLERLGALRQAQGRSADAEQCMRRAAAILRDSRAAARQCAPVLSALAGVLVDRRQLEEAEAILRRSLAALRDEIGGDDECIAYTINNLGWTHHVAGDAVAAESCYRDALSMRRRLHASDHPLIALSLDNLAGALSLQRRFDEAIAAYREALALRTRRFGESHPDVATSQHWLGCLLARCGHPEEARALLSAALETRRALLPADHPDIARSRSALATIDASSDPAAVRATQPGSQLASSAIRN